jgi:hypothetical protein
MNAMGGEQDALNRLAYAQIGLSRLRMNYLRLCALQPASQGRIANPPQVANLPHIASAT